MSDVGDLPGITHHDDVRRALEESGQNVEVVACKILDFIHENKRINTGKPLDDGAVCCLVASHHQPRQFVRIDAISTVEVAAPEIFFTPIHGAVLPVATAKTGSLRNQKHAGNFPIEQLALKGLDAVLD